MSAIICPRCLGEKSELQHEGRDGDTLVWSIHHCLACSYSWRDSEPASTVDPAVRDIDFRVDASDLSRFAIILPPTRR